MTNAFLTHSLAVKDATTKTIAGGVITIDQFYHVIAAQTGATDDLDTINLDYDSLSFDSTTYRPILAIIADSGDTITIKHGTGNIDLPDDTDVTLTDDGHVWLIYNGTNWTVFKAVLSSSSVTASMVAIDVLGSPTYTSVQDWLDTTQSAGLISGGTITDNLDGTVAVAAGTGFIKSTDSNVGNSLSFDWAQDTSVTLTDESDNWVYVDYNAGTPIIDADTILTNLDMHTQIVVGKVYREGTELHIIPVQQIISDFSRLVWEREWEINRVRRSSGLSLSETGTRNIIVSAGVLWAALSRLTTAAVDTSGAGTFTYYYRDGIGGWTEVASQTQIDNTNYDDNSGTPAALTAGRYGVFWVYSSHDGDVYVQYGQGDYTLAQAQAALVPTPPPELTAIGLLVGKIIIQKSAGSFTSIDSAFTQTFEGTTVTDHGALAGLTDDDHTQYALLAGRAGGQQLIGGTGAGDDLTLDTTSNGTKGSYILTDLPNIGTLAHYTGSGHIAVRLDQYAGAGAPGVGDDVNDGYVAGSLWVDTSGSPSELYLCTDNTAGAAVWQHITDFDGLAPTTTKGDIIVHNGSNNIRLGVGTDAYVLTADSGEASGIKWAAASSSGASYAVLQDQKSSGTAPGSASATTWNARDLNTEASDADNIVTISSNQFTPIAGTYYIHVEGFGRLVNLQRLRLYNVTGTAVVKEGLNTYAYVTNGETTAAMLSYIFTANGTDAYRIDHYTQAAYATNAWGLPLTLGTNEVYLTITLIKVA